MKEYVLNIWNRTSCGYQEHTFLEHNKVVMERMMRFKDKTPFSIENDIIDDDVNAESMEDQMKDYLLFKVS